MRRLHFIRSGRLAGTTANPGAREDPSTRSFGGQDLGETGLEVERFEVPALHDQSEMCAGHGLVGELATQLALMGTSP
jgi:hypothetical protein